MENRSTVSVAALVVCTLIGIASTMVEEANGRIIIVGEEKRWHFGANYTDWALKAAPFHVNDTLVFRYARPNGSIFHNVYRLPSYGAYRACNFQKAELLAHENAGYGRGFAYVLNEDKPYYFGCGIGDGFHCKVGLMKFYVKPVAGSACTCASAR